MNARITVLVTACGIAALAILGFAARPTTSERVAGPSHGAFDARFQPVLEGIGSTRDLTPVPLNDADQTESPASGGRTIESDRHEALGRRR